MVAFAPDYRLPFFDSAARHLATWLLATTGHAAHASVDLLVLGGPGSVSGRGTGPKVIPLLAVSSGDGSSVGEDALQAVNILRLWS